MIEFLWNLRYDDDLWHDQKTFTQDPIMCITLSIALIYYFRLPTEEDSRQRTDTKTPTREELARIIEETIPGFERTIQDTLERFVNTDNFVIPQGVAINQAVCILSLYWLVSESQSFYFRFVNMFLPL